MPTDQDSIAAHLSELRENHRDLDQSIAALATQTSVDQLHITRLKRRKLLIKDQIIYWQSRQIPDLNA